MHAYSGHVRMQGSVTRWGQGSLKVGNRVAKRARVWLIPRSAAGGRHQASTGAEPLQYFLL